MICMVWSTNFASTLHYRPLKEASLLFECYSWQLYLIFYSHKHHPLTEMTHDTNVCLLYYSTPRVIYARTGFGSWFCRSTALCVTLELLSLYSDSKKAGLYCIAHHDWHYIALWSQFKFVVKTFPVTSELNDSFVDSLLPWWKLVKQKCVISDEQVNLICLFWCY